MKIINVDTVDQIDRLEMMKKQRRAKKEQLTIVFLKENGIHPAVKLQYSPLLL